MTSVILWRHHARDVVSSPMFHLFFAGLVVVLVFLHPPDVFSGDTDTARNYLNTIVSSLSTILALCISIILVAIQMTAGSYTPRVLDFYIRLPYNVSLFLFYLAAIMHSFFLMAQIRDPLNDPLPKSLDLEMSSDLVMVIICFLSLLAYMYAVVKLLKPDRIIQLIVREYRKSYGAGRFQSAMQNIEQICDIAKRAASFNDSVTGMYCIQVMTEIVKGLPLPAAATAEGGTMLEMHRSMVEQWGEIVGVAVKERETGVLDGALGALRQQGKQYVEGRAYAAARLVVRAYHRIMVRHLLVDGHAAHIPPVMEGLAQLSELASLQDGEGQALASYIWSVLGELGSAVICAQPGFAPVLLPAFLMQDPLAPTIQSVSSAERLEITVSYFALLRDWVPHLQGHHVRKWAKWWLVHAPQDVKVAGCLIAIELSEGLGLTVAVQILRRVFVAEIPALVPEASQVDLDVGDDGQESEMGGTTFLQHLRIALLSG